MIVLHKLNQKLLSQIFAEAQVQTDKLLEFLSWQWLNYKNPQQNIQVILHKRVTLMNTKFRLGLD